jgi:GNAT superfamily N-acetyltransferase
MTALSLHKPALASVLDLERPEQLDEVLSLAAEAAQHATEAVIIIPKVVGIIASLPRVIGGLPVRLGYSVPTRFAGTTVPLTEFAGWPMHLLGGSPNSQMAIAREYPAEVVSADGNYAQKSAGFGKAYAWGMFKQLREMGHPEIQSDVPYLAFELSMINIRNKWRGQVGYIRFGKEDDLPAIVRIIRASDKELGGVFYPSLRRGIDKRELYVYIVDECVVGFINWHAVKQGAHAGMFTVYDLAVAQDYRRQGIGRDLLDAVPHPIRLKCTVDNLTGNAFYERMGMTLTGVEDGKRHKLNVWRTQ